jgi:hypothetical protein
MIGEIISREILWISVKDGLNLILRIKTKEKK